MGSSIYLKASDGWLDVTYFLEGNVTTDSKGFREINFL